MQGWITTADASPTKAEDEAAAMSKFREGQCALFNGQRPDAESFTFHFDATVLLHQRRIVLLVILENVGQILRIAQSKITRIIQAKQVILS
jgi:hypothetical protein